MRWLIACSLFVVTRCQSLQQLLTQNEIHPRGSSEPVGPQILAGFVSGPVSTLGQQCANNFTCASIANAYCSSQKSCLCMPNFVEDHLFVGTCRLAPGYNELCHQGHVQCRQPFVCNKTNLCDCPAGFVQEYFQCIKDCPRGWVPIGDTCFQSRHLEEPCELNEQCVQTYVQCLHKKCQCIQGANQENGECIPVSQCPLGEPLKDAGGSESTCRIDEPVGTPCPNEYYCMQADVTDSRGFCCPKIKMNCPVGQPLEGVNCTACPAMTHHCFTYVIGRFTDTMCCPNACPTTHPIQKDGNCYARSAFGGHCSVDDQCYNTVNAVCRLELSDNSTKCLCPIGEYKYQFGRCFREGKLGETCQTNEDCQMNSGMLCVNKVCSCAAGLVPEPVRRSTDKPTMCIGEPTCPTPTGRVRVDSFVDCSFGKTLCKESEVCRSWWTFGNITYSVCCPKPSESDYRAICARFNLTLVSIGAEPRRCDILTNTANLFDATPSKSESKTCPTETSCIFDPFSINRGICCQPATTKTATTESQTVTTVESQTVATVENPNLTTSTNQPRKVEEVKVATTSKAEVRQTPPKNQRSKQIRLITSDKQAVGSKAKTSSDA